MALINMLFKAASVCGPASSSYRDRPTFYARYAADFSPQVYEGLLKQAMPACW